MRGLEILWLLHKLEAEAAAQGGGVNLLLGNHESMVLRGDLRYLNPTWYRGYSALDGPPPPASAADVDEVLGHFGVRRILVGRTQLPTVTALFDGRVIGVQVYPHRSKVGGVFVFEGLLIRDGRYYRAKVDGTLEVLLPARRGLPRLVGR